MGKGNTPFSFEPKNKPSSNIPLAEHPLVEALDSQLTVEGHAGDYLYMQMLFREAARSLFGYSNNNAAEQTVAATFFVEPRYALTDPALFIRMYEIALARNELAFDNISNGRMLYSGAGILAPEFMSIPDYEVLDTEDMLGHIRHVDQLGFPAYFDVIATSLAVDRIVNPGGAIIGSSSAEVRLPENLSVLMAEPNLSQYSSYKDLINCLPEVISEQISQDSDGSIVISEDTHQDLIEKLQKESLDQLVLARLDPLSLLPDARINLKVTERYNVMLGTLIELFKKVREGGFIFLSVGSGNNDQEYIQRHILTVLLSRLLKESGIHENEIFDSRMYSVDSEEFMGLPVNVATGHSANRINQALNLSRSGNHSTHVIAFRPSASLLSNAEGLLMSGWIRSNYKKAGRAVKANRRRTMQYKKKLHAKSAPRKKGGKRKMRHRRR